MLSFGHINANVIPAFIERMQKIALDFALQHQSDNKRPTTERNGYTAIMAIRPW